MQDSLTDHTARNGELPADDIDVAVSTLINASAALREHRDTLKAALDAANERLTRYDRAITALTAPKRDRSHTERGTVKQRRLKGSQEPGVNNAAKGYPIVSAERQQVVLDALAAVGEPISPSDLADRIGVARSSAQAALAHLRARGLVRQAGVNGRKRLYAVWTEDTVGDADTDTDTDTDITEAGE